VPRGGRRQGAGRKPKSATQHFLGGNAGKRSLAIVPPSRADADAPPSPPAIVLPVDLLSQEGEQAYWHRYASPALAAGTLTRHTVGGFVLLCQVAARADRMWEDIEREGLTATVDGLMKAHPLLPAYRGLVQRQESLLQRYLLAAMAKPDLGATPKSKEDDDSAALRQLMAIK
jgi:hypothetical protein